MRRDHPPLRAPAIGGQEPAKQRIFEDLEVAPDRLAGDAGVPSDGRVVDHVTVGERGDSEEVSVGGQSPREGPRLRSPLSGTATRRRQVAAAGALRHRWGGR